MESSSNHILLEELNIRLDRSAIDRNGLIQQPQGSLEGSSDTDCTRNEYNSESEPIRAQIHHTNDHMKQKHRATDNIKKTLHISPTFGNNELEKRTILAYDADEQSKSRLVHDLPLLKKHTLKDVVHHPIEALKSKLSKQGNHQMAASIVTKEVSHGQEVDLVNAHTAISHAKTEKEKLFAVDNLSRLISKRQKTFVRWTLDRHVTKVRALPQNSLTKPARKDFEKHTADQGVVMDWRAYTQKLLVYSAQLYGGQYIGYGLDPPAPSKKTIMPNIERLIVATSPLQEFIMATRRISSWEKSAETTKYMLIYLGLWYFNSLLPGAISAVLYFLIKRRVHANNLDDLRQDILLQEDTQLTAQSLVELIDKVGDERWMDDLFEGMGPWLMVQLADMAGFCESVRSFYEWRVPYRTLRLLMIFAVAIPLSYVVPSWILVKSITLSMGVAFFFSIPIATSFPEYRLLVSPSKRLLWNIPTNAEWAIRCLQAEGTCAKEQRGTPATTSRERSTNNQQQGYGSYFASESENVGRLVIYDSSVCFVSEYGNTLYWDLVYDDIDKLEKRDRIILNSISSKLRTDSGKDIHILIKTGEEKTLRNVGERDEVFSQIVGLSSTTWQVAW